MDGLAVWDLFNLGSLYEDQIALANTFSNIFFVCREKKGNSFKLVTRANLYAYRKIIGGRHHHRRGHSTIVLVPSTAIPHHCSRIHLFGDGKKVIPPTMTLSHYGIFWGRMIARHKIDIDDVV